MFQTNLSTTNAWDDPGRHPVPIPVPHFIEPLLRWLEVNSRGYRFGTTCHDADAGYANSVAFADDLAITADSIEQLQIQAHKLERYCAWSGLTVTTHKCALTGTLHRAHADGTVGCPSSWATVEPSLTTVSFNGRPLPLIKPEQPFKYLGVQFTLTLDWTYQYKAAVQTIQNRGAQLLASMASMSQKHVIEEQCLLNSIRYSLCVAPYTVAQVL